jgi:hypothetical protein
VSDFLEAIVSKAFEDTLEGTLDMEAMIQKAEELSSQAVDTILVKGDTLEEAETLPGEPAGGVGADADAADKVAAYSFNAIHSTKNPMRSRTQVSPYHTCLLSSTM